MRGVHHTGPAGNAMKYGQNSLEIGRRLNAGFMSLLCTACCAPSIVTRPLPSNALITLPTYSAQVSVGATDIYEITRYLYIRKYIQLYSS